MDQGCCLQRPACWLAPQVFPGQTTQFRVHSGCQAIQGCFVSGAPGLQKDCDIDWLHTHGQAAFPQLPSVASLKVNCHRDPSL